MMHNWWTDILNCDLFENKIDNNSDDNNNKVKGTLSKLIQNLNWVYSDNLI